MSVLLCRSSGRNVFKTPGSCIVPGDIYNVPHGVGFRDAADMDVSPLHYTVIHQNAELFSLIRESFVVARKMPSTDPEPTADAGETPRQLPFPPVTRSHILHCSYHYWQPLYGLVWISINKFHF